MLLGLLATIAGYFDEEIGSGVFDLPSPIRADGEPEDASKITTLNRTAWLLLQSLQYIGPIFMVPFIFKIQNIVRSIF
jgi:hypothetical protein